MPSLQTIDELQNSEQGENANHNNRMSESNTPISLENVIKECLIAQGNIGEIFKVTDTNTNQCYISKTLYVHYQDYPKQSRIDIIKHINKMKQLNFPPILKLYDFNTKGFDKETRPTILLEYFPNGSLEDVLNLQISPLNNTKKFIIIYGIAKSFQYLHFHDILHHDLKPSSIMIDDNLYPKIGNIGFSNLFYGLKSMAKIKEISPYTAPEYIINSEYSKPNEVYAFGMIVYQIISNKKPFKNISQFEMLQRIASHDLPIMDDSIPKVYRDLIEKCCSMDPNDRYNFEEICKELKVNDDFLINLEREDEFKQYIKLIDDFVEENKSFNQLIESDNLMIENKEINQKKMKKKKKRKKKE